MPIDRIEEILEGVKESEEKNEEINLIINGNNNLEEDEDLLKALDDLMKQDQETTDNKNKNDNMNARNIDLPEVPKYPILPPAPTTEIINDKSQELFKKQQLV